MDSTVSVLMYTALTLALTHTVLGVDHYLPFVVLGRANKWSVKKLMLVTFLCGVGHVLSSVLLGFIGLGIGTALSHLEWIESFRGEVVSYMLIAFGLVYTAWGVRRAIKNRPHTHSHMHPGGDAHEHKHTHVDGAHAHAHEQKRRNVFWALFIVFVLGPCEPLIPLLIYPAAKANWGAAAAVAGIFSVVTITVMMAMTLLLFSGLKMLNFKKIERWSHALAGTVILTAGCLIVFVGI